MGIKLSSFQNKPLIGLWISPCFPLMKAFAVIFDSGGFKWERNSRNQRGGRSAGRRSWALYLFLFVTAGFSQDDAVCLECHGDTEKNRADDSRDPALLVTPETISASVHASWECIDCHEGYDPEATPHRTAIQPVSCVGCHEDFDPATHAFHPQLADPSVSPRDPAVDCRGCHGDHDVVEVKSDAFRFAPSKLTAACGACHEEAKNQFLTCAHSQSEGDTPDCLSCHRTDLVEDGRTGVELKLAQSRLCMSCHVERPEAASWTRHSDRFVASWGSSIHGRALSDGNEDAANCVDCHGSHRMNRAMVADSKVNKLHIPETCANCHQKEAELFGLGVHADALRAGVMDSPVCTDCHGEHLILQHEDPRALIAPRNVSEQLCGACHGSVRLSRKYGISSDRFETFTDSFHGLAIRGGAVEVVNCASCHGAHAIFPSNDPRSPVHKGNLAHTCGECHPRANELFGVGKVHVSLEPVSIKDIEGQSVVQIIATIYVWVIVGVIGSMFLHNLIDFIRKTRDKVIAQRFGRPIPPTPHRLYLRMTVNERLQHAALALSFVVLVVTGFMLSYPEAWWVQGLRGLNSHLFELRGLLHRIAGVAMIAAGLWHITYTIFTVRGRQVFRDILPRMHDFTDMFAVLRFNLGLARTKPKFGRFSYIEKAEYWAMMWGSILMGFTGGLLWGEATTMGILTKLGFDISLTIHFYEAILATLAIIVWHFYFVIFNPDVYPMNLSWLTGELSTEEMESEHPAELERLKREAEEAPEPSGKSEDPPAKAP